jgi:pimeloyl-ACP methyl ester carboxylesterase
MPNESTTARGYAPINGLSLYYEISGRGDPLVYIPPALSYGSAKAFPLLSQHHSLIKVDLQGGGRTADVPERAMSLQQHAHDIVGLLDHLGIAQSDFFGESYGGAVAALIALQHPDRVGRVATYGATFGPPAVAFNTAMLHFDTAPTPGSPCFDFQREQYQAVAPQPDYWPRYWEKTLAIQWEGFSNEELAAIHAPVLIALGDRDFVRVEHAVDTFRRLPNAQLAVIPDAGHFAVFSEPERVIPVIQHFLNQPLNRIPVGNSQAGYQPGKTR